MIHLQDARKFLPFIPDNSVDLVVTDPPYPVISGGRSTGVAALESGRRFLGCEIDPKYHAIACRRMKIMPL